MSEGFKELPSIPGFFPATVSDRIVSAFFSPKCDVMLQVELNFADRLDRDLLSQALILILDAEPVLGCRFSIEEGQALWRRLRHDERTNFSECTDDRDFRKYKEQSIDPYKGPAVHGVLLRGPDGDTVLLKIAHEAADAGGAKDIAYLLASLYRALKKDPRFKPSPNVSGSRGLDQVMRHVPFYAFPRIWLNALRTAGDLMLHRAACNPFHAEVADLNRDYIERAISAERAAVLKNFGMRSKAKLNDLLLTAFIRSFSAACDGKTRVRCAMTVDLRKWYLPGCRAEAAANLSGIEIVRLSLNRGETFAETLMRVARFTEERKRNWIGLTQFPGMLKLLSAVDYHRLRAFFQKQQYKDRAAGAIFPMITNLGPIDEEKLCFETLPRHARILVPAAYPPYFGIGVSGYQGGLTLSAAAFPETRRTVNEILDGMLDELPE